MQIANNNIEFKIGTQKNIVELKTELQGLEGKLSQLGGQLVPIEKGDGPVIDELLQGRLPEFCPEAFAPVVVLP